jgi:hypothetical protein
MVATRTPETPSFAPTARKATARRPTAPTSSNSRGPRARRWRSVCRLERPACSCISRNACLMGCSSCTFVEERSLLLSVRLACRRVRTCTDRGQPRRKIVRRRQVTRTSRPHSRKWRVVGCCLPSKWSGWTIRTRPKRAKTKRRNLAPGMCFSSEALTSISHRQTPEGAPETPALELEECSVGFSYAAMTW